MADARTAAPCSLGRFPLDSRAGHRSRLRRALAGSRGDPARPVPPLGIARGADDPTMLVLEHAGGQRRAPPSLEDFGLTERGLRELFDALGWDSIRIQECLVRPILVERLARRRFAADPEIHRAARAAAERLHARLRSAPGLDVPGHPATIEELPLDRLARRSDVPAQVGIPGPVLDEGDRYAIHRRRRNGRVMGPRTRRAALQLDPLGGCPLSRVPLRSSTSDPWCASSSARSTRPRPDTRTRRCPHQVRRSSTSSNSTTARPARVGRRARLAARVGLGVVWPVNGSGRGDSWLGSRDSNPDSTVQSRMSYHWTTPQRTAKARIIAARGQSVPGVSGAPAEGLRVASGASAVRMPRARSARSAKYAAPTATRRRGSTS